MPSHPGRFGGLSMTPLLLSSGPPQLTPMAERLSGGAVFSSKISAESDSSFSTAFHGLPTGVSKRFFAAIRRP